MYEFKANIISWVGGGEARYDEVNFFLGHNIIFYFCVTALW